MKKNYKEINQEMTELLLPIPTILDADPQILSGDGPSFAELFGE